MIEEFKEFEQFTVQGFLENIEIFVDRAEKNHKEIEDLIKIYTDHEEGS